MSLEDLLNSMTAVGSKREQSLRSSPAIVTVISHDEIMAMNARDLLDVLHFVPGLAFGTDVEGVVSVGVRGVWGHEGKVLLLVDGQELNELLYSTLSLGTDIPVEQIDRVEVIRGPGSAVYGGHAELAVINVITRGANLEGASASAQLGVMTGGHGGFGNREISLEAGKHFKDVALSVGAAYGEGLRSDRDYVDVYGGHYDMSKDSLISMVYVNAALAWKGLHVRFLEHDQMVTTRDGYDAVLLSAAQETFHSSYFSASYTFDVAEHLKVTPLVRFKRQTPWEVLDTNSTLYYSKTVDRALGGVQASYDFTDKLNLLAGVEAWVDHAWLNSDQIIGTQTYFVFDGKNQTELYFNTLAAYAQLSWDSPWVNVTAGARYEVHSYAGGAFVPRVALTRTFGRAQVKLLYANAFREPGIENISLGNNIKPEFTTAFEAEAGYQVTDTMYAGVNVYDLTLSKPIVYGYDVTTQTENYKNDNPTGSRGLELEYRFKTSGAWANVAYSFYSSAGKNQVETYALPDREDLVLAFPGHKVTLNSSFNVYGGWWVNPSVIFMSDRYAYTTTTTTVDDQGNDVVNGVVTDIGSTLLVNLFISRKDLFQQKGLEASFGVANLLNANYSYPEPYSALHAPLPAQSREILLRLTYTGGGQ